MPDGNEVSLVSLKPVFNSKLSNEEENILWIEEEYKFIEEKIPKFDDGELVGNKDVHSCEYQDLLLGESNKLVDEVSLTCPT